MKIASSSLSKLIPNLRSARNQLLSSVPHRTLSARPSIRTAAATPAVSSMTDMSNSYAQKLVDFINESWTPFHAVAEAKRRLSAAGFTELDERAPWEKAVRPGGRYFFTRNQSTIVAFAVGEKAELGAGFHVIGAHTDSPCLKLKPISKSTKSGYMNVGVETYGGGLWATWFDRDLSVAGRVLLRGKEGFTQRLVRIDRPILRIPMLAIHLNREISTEGFKLNTQTHLSPILATSVKGQLDPPEGAPSSFARHHPLLLQLVAEELRVDAKEIADFELHVCDVQPGTIGGARNEFIFAGRLDNLCMSYCALQALIESCSDEGSLAGERSVRCIALFDHEEVGSESMQGAGGPVMLDTIRRVSKVLGGGAEGCVERSLQNSFLVSADMAHALHPNYADKHEPEHQPQLHKGLVIKYNGNQRYATNLISSFLFREVATRRGIPTQDFCVRNDMACGSTIGPIVAGSTGMRTVDVGTPQFAMHSIRETCGVDDVEHACRHFRAFFEDFSQLKETVQVDNVDISGFPVLAAGAECQHIKH